ncbi:right-handed parallel beta-helix repeat-containing protein, partial [Pseudoxanthomonas japonensis]
DVVLEDLLIHSTGRDGIKITPKSNRATIRRVEIHSTGARDNSNADGIDNVNADGMLVEDSYIHDTATTGMYFKGGARDVVVQRNRVENTGDAGILVGFDTSVEFFDLSANPQYYESIRGIVRNNVVRNTGYSGIGMYASKDAIVANNTIINAGRLGHSALYFGVTFQDWDPKAGRPANTNPTLRNNLVIQDNNRCVEIRYSSELGGLSGLSGSPNSNWNGFNNGCVFRDGRPGSTVTAGTLAQWRSGTGADANSKQAAFSVDATGHLPAGSPAIDAGTTLAQVTDDIDGQARSAPFDLGADEYGQQSTAPIRVNGVQPLVPVRGTSAASTPVTAGSLPSGSASAVVPSSTPATTTAPSVSTAKPTTTRPAAARQYTPPAVRAWRWLLAWVGWLN